ncbi:MAG: peptidase S41, partial [Bacteroidota bacterium]
MKGILKISLIILSMTTIGFAQNTPLWMRYPAISPDGSQIVFSYQGDLFLINSKGGTAVPITRHEGHDYMPVWSNDGKSIAFASDRYGNFDVFIMPSTGGIAERLTHHSANDFPSDFSTDDQQVIFTSLRLDMASSVQFPNRAMPELYSVATSGGTPKVMNTMPAEYASFSKDGNTIIYHDRKGYENEWRKHHQSSITRDIWAYNTRTKAFTQLTNWEGEDRNPVMAGNNKAYFLSERSGSFNVHTLNIDNPQEIEQLTSFANHPVRFLTSSDNGKLCFTYDGEIYIQTAGQSPVKLPIRMAVDSRSIAAEIMPVNGNVTEIALSPNGKEIAYVVRGEVFVTAVDNALTKRITNTPEQERSISFSNDGRSLLYAGERANNWNIYQSSIKREEEAYFYSSTVISEEAIVATSAEEFQPSYSPNGKEVAYLEERTTLKTVNLSNKATKTILPAKYNYSYSDGDQFYSWSPDSKWLLVQYLEGNWITEVGLVSSNGDQQVINLTNSGFFDTQPKWAMDGNMMIWTSNRDGQKDQGSWGAEGDVYGMFFNQQAFDRFNLSKAELELLIEKESDGQSEDGEETKPELDIDLKNIEDRKTRLTIHSTNLRDAVLSPDGETLYYLTNIDKGYDIWTTKLRDKSTKRLAKLGSDASNLIIDKKGKDLFVQSD